MKSFDHHLAILGLDSFDSLMALKSAFRREMLKWHPDRHQHDPAMLRVANERARKIIEAFEILSKAFESGEVPSFAAGRTATAQEPRRRNPKRKTRGRRPFAPGFPDASVKEIFVRSSNIVSAGYNDAKSVLYLKFRDHSVYGYFGVPEEMFTRFMQADSHGGFANYFIFSSYRSKRFCW